MGMSDKTRLTIYSIVAIIVLVLCAWGYQRDQDNHTDIQRVQIVDKSEHIITRVEGRDLRVSDFAPDLKVQWVEERAEK